MKRLVSVLIVLMISSLVVSAVSCGGDQATPTPTPVVTATGGRLT